MRDEFADGHEDMDWASSTTLMILIEFSHLYKYVKYLYNRKRLKREQFVQGIILKMHTDLYINIYIYFFYYIELKVIQNLNFSNSFQAQNIKAF